MMILNSEYACFLNPNIDQHEHRSLTKTDPDPDPPPDWRKALNLRFNKLSVTCDQRFAVEKSKKRTIFFAVFSVPITELVGRHRQEGLFSSCLPMKA
jgi:hypothetical protein